VVITAHVSGRIFDWKAFNGSFHSKGEVIGKIASLDRIIVASYALQNETHMLSPGLHADLILSDNRRLRGQLLSVSGNIDGKGRLKTYWQADASAAILPGTIMTVLPDLGVREGMLIPLGAVLDIDGQSVVFTLRNDTARWNTVQTRWYNKDSVEVISGIAHGDTLIISNLLMLHEGTAVKVIEK
jgi:HlyD family secretion protein